jgi:hypothetical protein
MSYIFLSHSSHDKPKLGPLVLRMLDLGFQFWIDAPGAISTDSRLVNASSIPYGGDEWAAAVETGILEKDCIVLFVWSENAEAALKRKNDPNARGSLAWEIAQGYNGQRFRGVRIDKTPMAALGSPYKDLNFCQIAGYVPGAHHPEFDRFLTELAGAVNNEHAKGSFRGTPSGPPRKRIDPSAVFRANRLDQSLSFLTAAKTLSAPTRQPLQPLFIVGPRSESPDEFLARCWDEANSRRQGKPLEPIEIAWPKERGFRAQYLSALADLVTGDAGAEPKDIAQQLSTEARPRAFYSFASALGWPEDQAQRLKAWLDLWAEIDEEAEGGACALPILCVRMQEVHKPWRELPPTPFGQPIDNKRIMNELRTCTTDTAVARAKANLIQILEPINRDDADTWAASMARDNPDEFKRCRNQVVAELNRLFVPRRSWTGQLEQGVASMKMFADGVQPILAKKD